MFESRFMPCPECGASLDRSLEPDHACSTERRVDFQMFALRDEVAQLESGVHHYLGTTLGRFEVWQAARQVRAAG